MENLIDIKVLYVEDEPITRAAVSAMLARQIRTVYEAGDGREGLALFKEFSPDIVITDIRMPVMDGIAMAREIKAVNARTHIIVTTALSDTEFFLQAIDIGIDQYVPKPVEREKLFAAVWKCQEVLSLERAVAFKDAEQKRLIRELQDALASIKTLRGLIPICSACKKVRDDQGYWKQVEAYITEHSDAEFTHGICPSCASRMYSEYLDDRKKPNP